MQSGATSGSFVRFCYSVLRPIVGHGRTHPVIVRVRFGARVPKGVPVAYDTTTLALRRTLPKWLSGRKRILEIGVGSAALLLCFVARKSGRQIEGTDISQARVESARSVTKASGLEVRLWQSDLFENVSDRYDLIYFNPPYVPSSIGRRLGLADRAEFDSDERVWDGGSDGTEVIRRTLVEAPERLLPGGVLLLGVQNFHIGRSKMLSIIERSGMSILEMYSFRTNPSTVWVLSHGAMKSVD